MSTDVPVRVRDCACPHRNGKLPHPEGDIVYLRAKPSLPLGLAVQGSILSAAGSGSVLQALWMVDYVRHGVTGWNFVDISGKPRPLEVQELVDDFEMGQAIGNQADELYGDTVVTPLVQRLSAISPDGPTEDSTSQAPESTTSPSEPSSPVDTAVMEPSMP